MARAFPWLVEIAQLTVAAAHPLRFAQRALHVGAGHAGANLLADDGLAPFLWRDLVAAHGVSLTDYYYLVNGLRAFPILYRKVLSADFFLD
ncbi:hypothetical protein D3C80_1623150 [compost metagenome]